MRFAGVEAAEAAKLELEAVIRAWCAMKDA